MNRQSLIKPCTIVLTMLIVFLFSLEGDNAQAASYTMNAPEAFYSVKLPQDDYYSYNPLYNFSLKLEGWVCSERFAETTIYRIREVNRLIQALSAAQTSFVQLEKMLAQAKAEKMAVLSRQQIENIIYKSIVESIKNTGLLSERIFIDRVESLSKEIVDNAKEGINKTFNYWGEQNIFQSIFYGTPSGIWKLSKMDQEDRSVVFTAQNCYQKNDIDTMMNTIVSAGQKLQDALKQYKDTKNRLMEPTGGK
jgi:hypothetical protein